jgi:hypothetical protein
MKHAVMNYYFPSLLFSFFSFDSGTNFGKQMFKNKTKLNFKINTKYKDFCKKTNQTLKS